MATNKAFLGINLDLLENPKYKNLDSRALILYSLYADRYTASMHNARLGNTAFVDDMGVFIRFTNELAAKVIRVSEKLIGKLRKQLVDAHLINVVRDGLKGYKIYVYPVDETPANVELILPWKNHNINIVKTVSDWTTLSKLEFCKKLKNSVQTTDMIVKDETSTTHPTKRPTSLSLSSLSHVFDYNGLNGNTPARACDTRETQNQSNKNYHSLPKKIKKSFNTVFGFINNQIAIELHTLIDNSNVDMVNYAIESSKDRRITSPIAYLKAAITNALKRGDKCVQDMKNYYEKHVKKSRHTKKTKYTNYAKPQSNIYTPEESELLLTKTDEEIRTYYPELFLKRLQHLKGYFDTKPEVEIPIYALGE